MQQSASSVSQVFQSLVTVLGVVGSLASVVGLPLVFLQIRKTRRATDAALAAVETERRRARREALLSEISMFDPIIDDIRAQIRTDRFEAAQMRASQLASRLVRIRHVSPFQDEVTQSSFDNAIAVVSDLSNELEMRLRSRTYVLKEVELLKDLSRVQIFLGDQLGRLEANDDSEEVAK